ncbi:MAG: hypothetical protein ABR885_16025, partial [Mycobacterium sp.]
MWHRRTRRRWLWPPSRRPTTLYELTDCLHNGRTLCVSGDAIAHTVATWLAELGTSSPLVDDLARAACAGDWPAAHAIGDCLSVDVRALAAISEAPRIAVAVEMR